MLTKHDKGHVKYYKSHENSTLISKAKMKLHCFLLLVSLPIILGAQDNKYQHVGCGKKTNFVLLHRLSIIQT